MPKALTHYCLGCGEVWTTRSQFQGECEFCGCQEHDEFEYDPEDQAEKVRRDDED